MTEIVFLVEEDAEGGYTARAMGESIVTEAGTMEELRKNVLEAVECHFGDLRERPKIIRLHVTRDEILTP